MKDKFVNNSMSFILKYYPLEGKKHDKTKYGLETIYSLVIKTSVIFVCSLLLNTLKETFILIVVYTILRCFSFGLHASKNVYCWISTLAIYTIIPLFIKYIQLSQYFLVISGVIGIIFLLLFAPADTAKRPLINPKKRKMDKILSVILGIIVTALMVITDNKIIINSCSLALILQAIMINPLTYKLLNQPFNNYLQHNKNMA